MNLYEQLKQLADYNGKYNYCQLVEKLKEKAKEGKHSIEISADEAIESDVQKLTEEDIKVEFKKGLDYDYWEISWY